MDWDIVVLCKTCKYETSVRAWVAGKNKYQCYCTGLTENTETL